jgi:small subunit ribosomal protein S17
MAKKQTKEKVNKKEEQKMKTIGLQVLRGRVVSAKLPKTVTVIVESTKMHPLYGKAFRRSKKYLAQDELGVTEGDLVEIVKIRPVSKNKHFQVAKVVGKDIEALVAEELKEDAKEAIAEVMPEETEEPKAENVEELEEKNEKKSSVRKEKASR